MTTRTAVAGCILLGLLGSCGREIEVDGVMPWHINEQATIKTLAQLRPNGSPCCVTSVTGGKGLVLDPDQPAHANGYVLTLHVTGGTFRVDAVPEREIETGRWTFFRTEDGIVRYSDGRPVPVPAE
jgi:hypothetical protein